MVNQAEAERVREIFTLYLRHESLVRVLGELRARGWTTKTWTTRRGESQGGRPFEKAHLRSLLSNVLYVGRVRHHREVYPGLQDPIVPLEVWEQVQALKRRNQSTRGALLRDKYGALLRGLLRCRCCNAAMFHSPVARGPKRYRYYVCSRANKRGYDQCPTGTVNAHRLEQAVLARVRSLPIAVERLAGTPSAEAAALFTSGGEALSTREQARLLRMVLQQVEYDRRSQSVRLTLTTSAAAAMAERVSA